MDISFLEPNYLWALPAAGLPVIVHFLFRQKPVFLEFSFIQFITRASRKNIRRSKIEQLLLLIIRCLLLVFLTLLFARPVLHLGALSQSKRGLNRSFVIMVDNSYSMGFESGGVKYFGKNIQTAKQLIARLTDSDRAGVIIFNGSLDYSSVRLTNNKDELIAALNDAKISNRPGDAGPAFRVAVELLKNNAAGNNVIVIFSDLAGNGWTKFNFSDEYKKNENQFNNTTLILADPSANVINAALTFANIEGSNPAEKVRVVVRSKNFSNPNTSLGFELFMNNLKRLQNVIDVKQGNERENVFTSDVHNQLSLNVRAVLSPDDLSADNEYWLYNKLPEKCPVLIVDGDAQLSTVRGESFFLKAALAQAGESSGIVYDISTPNELSAKRLADYKEVFFCNVKDYTADMIARMNEYVSSGGTLIFSAGDNVKKDAYAQLSDILPVELLSMKTPQQPAKIQIDSDQSHEFIQKLNLQKDFAVDAISVRSYFLARSIFGARVILRLDNGQPLFVERNIGKGRTMFFASSFDADWTNFPLKPLYPVFMRQLCKYAYANNTSVLKNTHFFAGDTLSEKDFTDAKRFSDIRILDLKGSVISNKKDLSAGITLEYPGVYNVFCSDGGNNISEWFDVNLKDLAEEGDYNKVSTRDIQNRLGGMRIAQITLDDNFVQRLFMLIEGKEATSYLFWVILMLLVFETVLANPKKREKNENQISNIKNQK